MNTQPRLFADTWPWTGEPPGKTEPPRCYHCHGPALADPHDDGAVWCSHCGSVEPRMDPETEAALRSEVRRRPQAGRRQRGPSHGATRL